MAIARFDAGQWSTFFALLQKKVSNPSELLRAAFATRGFRAIIEKFRDERGPDGPWPRRSPNTDKAYEDIRAGRRAPPPGFPRGAFRASNKLLQLTGTLRKSLLPGSLSKQTEILDRNKVLVFSPVPYSGHHDEGDPSRNLPARTFMWLSDSEQEDMSRVILGIALGEA